VNRHELLSEIHARLRPRNYLEIGVNDGQSLALSRVPSIAVDPAFQIRTALKCDLHLVRATSDQFFGRRDPIRHLWSGRNPLRNLRRGRPPLARYLGGNVLDFVFIDGMHWFEYALRDFMNVERFAGPASIVVIDDVYPRTVDEAARERHTSAWTGDVYKLVEVLRRHRPDLVLLPLDTAPTGTLVVIGADPGSSALSDAYERLVADEVTPDPQEVPARVLERRDAVCPRRFLDSPIIETLRSIRRLPFQRRRLLDRIRAAADELLTSGG
jgi:hypothetical protein